MIAAYAVEPVRAAERVLLARLPEGTLMGRAATGLARVCGALLGRVYGARVALLVGAGDNGGDALYAGAVLARRGARVEALLLGARAHAGGVAALASAGGRVSSDAARLDTADLVVDGILGIGGRGGLRPEAALVTTRAEAGPGLVVAVDVPSGVDPSTGEVTGAAVRADVTVTFGAVKPGLLVEPGAGYAGRVEFVDIGLGPLLGRPDVETLERPDVAGLVPRPTAGSDKYRRGVVGVVAGSDAYTGAAVLAVGGALRAGAGMVRYLGPDTAAALVRDHWPEAVLGPGRVQAWVVGPGLGTDEAGLGRLEPVLAGDQPAVLDADAVTLLGARGLSRRAPTVLTPHAGELARLLGVDRAEVEARRLHHARAAARRHAAVVLLKGATTVVAAPDGGVRVNPTGTPWLATAGSGDVLAGLVGTLLAAGLNRVDAASAGAWLHGQAGRICSGDGDGRGQGGPVTSYDVLSALPAAYRFVGGGPALGGSGV